MKVERIPKCAPTAFRKVDAALHCGISAGYFDRMVSEGKLPIGRHLGDGVKVWIRSELDDALMALPLDSEAITNPCDELLG